jgi:hypothetical protein
VRELRLAGTPLRARGCHLLAVALGSNRTLARLDMPNTQPVWTNDNRTGAFDTKGFCQLLGALEDHPALRTLNISDNKFEGAADMTALAKVLPQMTLETLEFRYFDCDMEHAKAIGYALTFNTKLKRFAFGFIEAGEWICMDTFREVTRPTLDLAHMGLGVSGSLLLLQSVCTMRCLVTLDLQCNDIGPNAGVAVAEAIRQSVNLMHINLVRGACFALHDPPVRARRWVCLVGGCADYGGAPL